jgi:hypothetical protein
LAPLEDEEAAGAFHAEGAVALEVAVDALLGEAPEILGLHLALPGRPRQLTLLLHAGFEPRQVQGEALLLGNILGQVHGKPEGVVELEEGVSRDFPVVWGREGRGHFKEALEAHGNGGGEGLLLHEQDRLDGLAVLHDLGKRLAHLGAHNGHEFLEEGLLQAQLLPVPQGPPQDLSQHIAAPLVGGDDPVGHEKGAGPRVVGDDPE